MKDLFKLSMEHVGQITQVGDTYVFGLAQHQVTEDRHDTVYLNLAGSATSVEAVWASIVERRTVIFRGTDNHVRYIRHGGLSGQEKGETPYLRFQRRIPGLAIDHLILVDRRFSEVEYNEVGVTFLFDAPDLPMKLGDHIRQLVNIAVFPQWYEALAEAGREVRLIMPLVRFGHKVFAVSLDRTQWDQLITNAISEGNLAWPRIKPESVLPTKNDDGKPIPEEN